MIKQLFFGILALLILVHGTLPPRIYAAPPAPIETLAYADIADLVLPAEIVAKVGILEAIEIPSPPASKGPSNYSFFYVEATVEDLIKGPHDMPRLVNMIVELPLDGRGHAAKIKKTEQLIFARLVSGRSGSVQLIAPDAALGWTANRESLTRSILAAEFGTEAPPHVTGIDTGFSVAGTVAGERETQIFLGTDSRPVSLVISHHANEAVRWSVALGEIVDNSAPPPLPDTLLWYQLACHLPTHFPQAKLAGMSSEDAVALRADYDLVMQSLGDCRRERQH